MQELVELDDAIATRDWTKATELCGKLEAGLRAVRPFVLLAGAEADTELSRLESAVVGLRSALERRPEPPRVSRRTR